MMTFLPVLEVKNISKAYRNYTSELWRILSWFGLRHCSISAVWTLQHVNFSIGAGEAIGIVGQNGAGKSTLLKIITGTLKPSTGSVTVRGKVSAILELGIGFHPDLTGRQNVYHSAGLMGYTVKEVDAVIDQVESFAEVGAYFDQPVRTYSSGMQMRVAFAIVTAYRPQILIVDEAMSVGDVYFQHKSFERIRQFQKEGTTLLFVSHDRAAIQAICNRVILLEQGRVIKEGEPEEVMDFYNALIADKENNKIEQQTQKDGKTKTTSGTGEVVISEIELLNAKGESAELIRVGESLVIKFVIIVNTDVESLVLGCGIKDRLGQMMFGTNTFYTNQMITNLKQGDVFEYTVSFAANLGVGSYSVHASLVQERDHIQKNYQWLDRAMTFSVVNVDKTEFVGCQWNEMKFNIQKKEY